MNEIVVVGSLNVDLVSTVRAMPREGQTVPGTSFTMHCGGKGANQAVAIARLGGRVRMVGALGDDAFAAQLSAALVNAGVDAGGIKRVPGTSGCATILVLESGSNCIIVVPGANAALQPADLDRERQTIAAAASVLCQLETPLETVIHLARIASTTGTPFLLDPAPMPHTPLPEELLKRVTWLTPNETETALMLKHLGRDDLDLARKDGVEEAARVLLASGLRNVLIKRGSQGIYMAGADCVAAHIAAEVVTAVDTTAAGDALNGAFALALAKGESALEAATFACKVAAFSVLHWERRSRCPRQTPSRPGCRAGSKFGRKRTRSLHARHASHAAALRRLRP